MEAIMAHVVHHHHHQSYVEETPIDAVLWIAGVSIVVIAIAALFVTYGGNSTVMPADTAIPMPPMLPMIPLL
jgi:hypothetical protein